MKSLKIVYRKSAFFAFLMLSLLESGAHAVEFFFERDPSLPLVYLNVAIKGGAASDPQDAFGISNFVGDMLLRGTKNRTKQQIDEELDHLGATLMSETRNEFIVLRGAVLSSQLPKYLALVKEIILSPSFPETEMRKLKKETISAILQALASDRELAQMRHMRFMFGDHPYGRFVLGTTQSVEKFSRKKLLNQHQTMFRKPHLLIQAAGDTNEALLREWVEDLTQKMPEDSKVQPIAPPTYSNERRVLIVNKPGRTQSQIVASMPGITMKDPRFFSLALGNQAFGAGSFSSRLMIEMRVKTGWSYGAGSSFQYGTQSRSWSYSFFPKIENTAKALAHSIEMVQELKAQGISQEEFDFAQQSIVNSAGFTYNTPIKRMENRLLELILGLPQGFFVNIAQEVQKVSLGEVNQSLKEFIRPDQLVVTVVGTAQELRDPLAQAVGIAPSKIVVKEYTEE